MRTSMDMLEREIAVLSTSRESSVLGLGTQEVIEFGLKHELLVTNTFFKKRQPIISPTRVEVVKRRLITSCTGRGLRKK